MFGIVTAGLGVSSVVPPWRTRQFATPADEEIAVANSRELLALPPRFTNSRTFRFMMAAYWKAKSRIQNNALHHLFGDLLKWSLAFIKTQQKTFKTNITGRWVQILTGLLKSEPKPLVWRHFQMVPGVYHDTTNNYSRLKPTRVVLSVAIWKGPWRSWWHYKQLSKTNKTGKCVQILTGLKQNIEEFLTRTKSEPKPLIWRPFEMVPGVHHDQLFKNKTNIQKMKKREEIPQNVPCRSVIFQPLVLRTKNWLFLNLVWHPASTTNQLLSKGRILNETDWLICAKLGQNWAVQKLINSK